MLDTKVFIDNTICLELVPFKQKRLQAGKYTFTVNGISKKEWNKEHLTAYTLQKLEKRMELGNTYQVKLHVTGDDGHVDVSLEFINKEVEDLTLAELVVKLKEWAKERDLLDANPEVQFTKIYEELGETATAMNKNWHDELVDSIGDLQVTIIILAHQLGIDLLNELDTVKLVRQPPAKHKYQAFAKIGIELGEVAKNMIDFHNKTVGYHLAKALLKVQHFSLLCKLAPITCLNKAYQEIANRKGKTVNGTFIKEQDL